MTSDEALQLLKLEREADFIQLQMAYDWQRAELRKKISRAATQELRAEYQSALDKLTEAFELLEREFGPPPSVEILPEVSPAAGLSELQRRVVVAAAVVAIALGALLLSGLLTRNGSDTSKAVVASPERIAATKLHAELKELLTAVRGKHGDLQKLLLTARRQGRALADLHRLSANLQKIERNLVFTDSLPGIEARIHSGSDLILNKEYSRAVALMESVKPELKFRLRMLSEASQIEAEIILLEIDIDGSYVWDGEVQTAQQLEARFASEARKKPQPKFFIDVSETADAGFLHFLIQAAQRHGVRGLIPPIPYNQDESAVVSMKGVSL